MIEITRARDVAGTPDDVAGLVADLERWPEWFALHKGWSGEVPTEAFVGARFRHKVRVLGMPGDVTWEVAEMEVPSRFLLKGKGPSRTSMEVDFWVAGRDEGSNVSFTAKLGGFALKPVEGKLKGWVEVRADRTLDGLERLLASG
jgi:hypothetical protein